MTVFHQNQSFSSPKISSRKPYTNSKQQERQNTVLKTLEPFLVARGSLSLRTGSKPVPYIQCAEYGQI